MTTPPPARIFFRANGQGFDVLCRIRHEMTPDRYLTQVTFRRNDQLHAEVLLGRHVSRDPVIGTSFASLEIGDEVTVAWQDISGTTGEHARQFDGEAD